jgi:DNA-binding transcriptional LysR family regulator
MADSHLMQVNARFHANSSDVVRRAVISGMRIGLLPEIAVAKELATGTLRRTITAYTPTENPIHILYPSRSKPPKLSHF